MLEQIARARATNVQLRESAGNTDAGYGVYVLLFIILTVCFLDSAQSVDGVSLMAVHA